jgi:hypothetical protein
MTNNNLETFLYVARIVVTKANQENGRQRNQNVFTNYFGALCRPPENTKKDRGELDPGEI